jgi:hypothetical protein
LVTGGDNAACIAKKFFGKKWSFFLNTTLVLKWGSKMKIEFSEKFQIFIFKVFNMKKVVRLTERDLVKIIKKVMVEQIGQDEDNMGDGMHYLKWTNKNDPEFFAMGKIEADDKRNAEIIYSLLDSGFSIEKATKEEYDEHVENGGDFFQIPRLS